MSLAGVDYNLHRIIKETLEKIEAGKSDKIIPIAKRIVLEEYFKVTSFDFGVQVGIAYKLGAVF